MSSRTIHLIHSECDVYVQKIGHDIVRVRIAEKDPEIVHPTDFEIEGSAFHISEALAAVSAVLVHIDELFQKEPN
jgi:hypothetical protein